MIIVLMGYMGSGKSTVGKTLSNTLNYKFIDLDAYISLKEEKVISKIFEDYGEIYFRKKEVEYLNEILSLSENIVLSLGGGTPCYGNTMTVILNAINVKAFYLKLSVGSLVARLFEEKNKRPLISHLNTEEELSEFIGKHLFERNYFYNQAHSILNIDGKNKKDVLELLLMQLI